MMIYHGYYHVFLLDIIVSFILRPLVLISLYRSEKIQNQMREGGKKHLRKKNIEPIFGKVNEGDEIKKNIGHISGKVYESDEIKKTFDLF